MRFIVALALVSTVALASVPKQVNIQAGHTATLSMPAPVSKVQVADPSMLEVSRKGRTLVLVGQKGGATDVTVKTVDGEVTLHVYVAADRYGMP